jgi:ATP-binding protein involved in chromosome partitioning
MAEGGHEESGNGGGGDPQHARAARRAASDTTCPGHVSEAEAQEARLAERLEGIRHKVVVLSGKGGVGKSTIAVNLAVALAERGMQVGLLDIDLHGPSVPKMLHLEGSQPGDHDGSVMPVAFTMNLKVMSIGFFLSSDDQAVIWRGPRKYSMIRQLLADVEWGELDYLIVDSPPGTGDEPLAILELLGTIDGAVVVTTPQQLSITDVRRSIAFCRELKCTVLGVIENMGALVCPHCGEAIEVFGARGGEALARETGVPFLGAVPMDPAVAISGDSGRPYLLSQSSFPAAEAFRTAIEPLLALAVDDAGAAVTQEEG